MFIRVKTTKNSPKKYVQIVESIREGSKVRQRIVRHVGYASDEDELDRLKDLGQYLMEKIKAQNNPTLFKPEDLTRMAIDARKAKEKISSDEDLIVDLKKLREKSRVVVGIHDIYGKIYDELGFGNVINPNRKVKSARVLKDIVMARIANPSSKRKNVKDLSSEFGIKVDLSAVYRMMDHIDEGVNEDIQCKAFGAASAIFTEPIDVIFYDCTTLYFETVKEDELKNKGYSKDMKFNQSQVLLALMVTPSGLPIGFKLYAGNTFEGHTLIDAVNHVKSLMEIRNLVFVADSAMLSDENIAVLEKEKLKYIVGARLKSCDKKIKAQILDKTTYRSKHIQSDSGYATKLIEITEDKRLQVSYCDKRAKKDAHDRQVAVDRLLKKLSRSNDPVSLINNYGYKKYLKSDQKGKIQINEKKIEESKKWDGLHGVITNLEGSKAEKALSHYHGLWEVEETFRISKHDMRVRPIFHWTQRRIEAHIAICFMALSCIRHLQYRITLQHKRLSPEVIRNELAHQQLSVLTHIETGKAYAIPSKRSQLSRKIYQIMGKRNSEVPYRIN